MTYEDLKAMPQDGNRYEIVDREPVASPAPSLFHQKLLLRFLLLIHAHLIRHNLGGDLFPAPVDVRLAGVRIVEPDIVYVSPTRRHILADPALIEGAPDLVVEALSPSKRAYDEQIKSRLFAEAGVLEYWIADHERLTLTIVALQDDGTYAPLPMEDGVARSRLLPGPAVDVPALFADLF